ncbi:MAG TPA: SRPBCC family protein [Acidimicrobiales bacterium]|jgi:uncharacterized protein YndB with AHSA1/START domain|nr:SRPBCC family protein [Acidimicrobiales bacterium]
MPAITASTEVARTPDTVFAYVTDPSRFREWQENVVGGDMDGSAPYGVGAKCVTTRRIGFAERPVTSEITHVDPPRAWGVRGVDGPIRATVEVTVRPVDDGTRSEITISLDFEGHGIGTLLVPLIVRRGARKEMPRNLQRLKARLEGPSPISRSA